MLPWIVVRAKGASGTGMAIWHAPTITSSPGATWRAFELRRRRLSFELAAAEFFSKGWGDRTPEALRVALRRSGNRPKGPRSPMTDWTREDRKLLGRLRRKGLTWAQVAKGISLNGIQRTPAACKVQAVSFRRRGGVT